MINVFALIFLPLESPLALYAVLFLILVLSGMGLPFPEEVTLFLGGYLSYLEFLRFWTTLWVLCAGILVADTLGYFLGRFAGRWIETHILSWSRHAITLLEKAKKYFNQHGENVVIFSRPLLGVRVAVPMLAGHFKMNFVKFLFYDAIAAIPWTFFLVSLSYYLGSGIDLITEVKEVKHAIFIFVGIGILLYAAIKFIKNNPQKSPRDIQ